MCRSHFIYWLIHSQEPRRRRSWHSWIADNTKRTVHDTSCHRQILTLFDGIFLYTVYFFLTNESSVLISLKNLSSFYFLSTAECFLLNKMTNEIPPKNWVEEQDEGSVVVKRFTSFHFLFLFFLKCCLRLSMCFVSMFSSTIWIHSVPARIIEWVWSAVAKLFC